MPQQKHIIKPATLSWSNSGMPFSEDYQDIYYSKEDALTESSYVFLEANQLAKRWANLIDENFIIGECGLGGCLNLLNTCKLWCNSFKDTEKKSTLYYIACDLHPFTKSDLRQLHENYPELKKYSDALIKVYPPLTLGIHNRELIIGDEKIIVQFLFGDAKAMFDDIWQANGFRVDTWFLDGFSPTLNSKMWDEEFCASLAALSKQGTTLSTYSAAGLIKQSLKQNNFTLKRTKGFGTKRHMLTGQYESINQGNSKQLSGFFQLPKTDFKNKHALIIGAGLAGCSTAFELAQTGWQVTLIERESTIASKASGNPRGIVYCKLSNNLDVAANYHLHAFLLAIEHYKKMAISSAIDWKECGLLQIAHDERATKRQNHAMNNLTSVDFVSLLDAEQASKVSGLELSKGGLFFPYSGYLNPHALCHAYSHHDNISCITDTEALQLNFVNDSWQVINTHEEVISADTVIIANSHDAKKFQQSQHYPLTKNHGQIDQYSMSALNNSLKCIVCAKGYILESDNAHYVGGVSYLDDEKVADTVAVSTDNIDLIKTIHPNLTEGFSKNNLLKSRTGIRCSSPDYLPIVGPVESKERCQKVYEGLSRNAKATITQLPAYEKGLFINVGHGSHGLSSTPLAAKFLSSLINNTPLPLSNKNIQCLHPIRYLIADLKKQRL